LIDDAASRGFTAQLEQFHKYIADLLRGYREIRDSRVRHACRAALFKYASVDEWPAKARHAVPCLATAGGNHTSARSYDILRHQMQ
jgi:hypothetical protein